MDQLQLTSCLEEVDSEDNWLEDIPGNLHRLGNLVTEDLVKPTESLISLLYQSVAIRDSKHSLQLGVSSMCFRESSDFCISHHLIVAQCGA